MTPTPAACPHCAQEIPSVLAARKYLCSDCQGRATDVCGWTVILFNSFSSTAGVVSPTGVAAKHDDGTPCTEVTERARAYVDGTAYRVVEGRFGGAFLQLLPSSDPPVDEAEPAAAELERYWPLLSAALAEEIQWLKDGDFLALDYETGDPAYALYGQLAPEDGTFHCEVVSNEFMPADDWPLDVGFLQQAGWHAPEEDNPNWFQAIGGAESAAAGIIAAMRHGRGCIDPRRFSWSPATFPGDIED